MAQPLSSRPPRSPHPHRKVEARASSQLSPGLSPTRTSTLPVQVAAHSDASTSVLERCAIHPPSPTLTLLPPNAHTLATPDPEPHVELNAHPHSPPRYATHALAALQQVVGLLGEESPLLSRQPSGASVHVDRQPSGGSLAVSDEALSRANKRVLEMARQRLPDVSLERPRARRHGSALAP